MDSQSRLTPTQEAVAEAHAREFLWDHSTTRGVGYEAEEAEELEADSAWAALVTEGEGEGPPAAVDAANALPVHEGFTTLRGTLASLRGLLAAVTSQSTPARHPCAERSHNSAQRALFCEACEEAVCMCAARTHFVCAFVC